MRKCILCLEGQETSHVDMYVYPSKIVVTISGCTLIAGNPLESVCIIAMFVQALAVSAWGSAMQFDVHSIFSNSLASYYILLLGAKHAMDKHKDRWNRFYLPLATFRNLCSVCVHSVLSCVSWTPDVPFRPGARTELCAEVWFSRCKSHFRGQPSIKAWW